MYTTVSLYQLNALVAGNGSYIVRPCGHDLHGPTISSTNDTSITYLFLYLFINGLMFAYTQTQGMCLPNEISNIVSSDSFITSRLLYNLLYNISFRIALHGNCYYKK